ncbi:hypothetical protein [Streptomyces sp. NPDC001657]|uniref:hypothetical protein n=1 Tax=Streptomyces sp. NPDC001657 TaxID=3154522 RepID=UPI003326C20C
MDLLGLLAAWPSAAPALLTAACPFHRSNRDLRDRDSPAAGIPDSTDLYSQPATIRSMRRASCPLSNSFSQLRFEVRSPGHQGLR